MWRTVGYMPSRKPVGRLSTTTYELVYRSVHDLVKDGRVHLALRAGRLDARMNSSAKRAADNIPPAPQSAATKLADRSGVKACRPSNKNAAAIRTAPTNNGLGHAKQTISVMTKYPRKWSNCQPNSVRGVQRSGPKAPITSRTMTAPLQTFAPARNRDFISVLMLMPISCASLRTGIARQ
jgi:hypothetical protein